MAVPKPVVERDLKKVEFRLPEAERSEWIRWMETAEGQGIPFREWLGVIIRQHFAPKPKPLGISKVERRRLREIYLMAGRLDAIFGNDWEDEIDKGDFIAWCQAHPDWALDVVQWLTAQADYGLRFRQWWKQAIVPELTAPSARNPGAQT